MLPLRKFFITENKLAFKILNVDAYKVKSVVNDKGELVDMFEYYVTVKSNKEDFKRVFVLTKAQANRDLFLDTPI